MTANKPTKYTSELRTTQEGEPIDCMACGHKATDPNPPRLIHLAPEKPGTYGSTTIDCWRCGPVTRDNNPERTAAEQMKGDVRDMLSEDQRKGEKGGGSSGSYSRKPRPKIQVRWEQDQPAMGSGIAGKVVVKNERIANADQRVKLYIPLSFREALETEGRRMERIDHRKWPLVKVIRSALWAHAKAVEAVKSFEYGQGDRVELQVMLYPGEKQLLDEMCKHHDCSHGEFVAACFGMVAR